MKFPSLVIEEWEFISVNYLTNRINLTWLDRKSEKDSLFLSIQTFSLRNIWYGFKILNILNSLLFIWKKSGISCCDIFLDKFAEQVKWLIQRH